MVLPFWNAAGGAWRHEWRSSPGKKPFSVFESFSSAGQPEEEEDDKMSDVGSHASEPSAEIPALSRECKGQARANVNLQGKHGGRSQAMKAVED